MTEFEATWGKLMEGDKHATRVGANRHCPGMFQIKDDIGVGCRCESNYEYCGVGGKANMDFSQPTICMTCWQVLGIYVDADECANMRHDKAGRVEYV